MPYPALDAYEISDPGSLLSPSLVIFRDLLNHNLDRMVDLAGGPDKLCPHCKTHKTPQIIQLLLQRGVTHHKCATLAEAEMLAEAGAQNVLIAYQMVGPNLRQLASLVERFPNVRFACLIDCLPAIEALSQMLLQNAPGRSIDVLLDIDSGMNRTGVGLGPEAIALYETIESMPALQAGGLHWYDGHHRQADLRERKVAVLAGWNRLTLFRNQLMMTGLPIPRIVAAGTGSFPILADVGEPDLQVSPGTTVLHDHDMLTRFPELELTPAQAIFTRVISNTRSGFLTLDVGHKACAADQPAGERLYFPQLKSFREVLQSEEHLVIECEQADEFELGDGLIAISRHACPVSAVHAFAYVIEQGQLVDRWDITARNRELKLKG